jgi:outer membrane protein assembly factor BamD (BamD/ComL family)
LANLDNQTSQGKNMDLNEAISSLDFFITIPDANKMRDALYLALTKIEQLENEIHFLKSEQAEMNRHIADLYKRTRSEQKL